MFNVGDRVRLVNWVRPPSPDTGTISGTFDPEAYYVQWDNEAFHASFRGCYWRITLLEAFPTDPLEIERRADQKRREEHAMRYL